MKHLFANSIAVTGGFASGKSTVAQSLAEMLDYSFFDADKEVADLLEKNAQGWIVLHGLLAPFFFQENGDINKQRLRGAIFRDDLLRKRVEDVLHPLVRDRLKNKVDEAYRKFGKSSLIILNF